MVSNPLRINLNRTQPGYVPLEDRFKSFPKDSEKSPVTDEKFYYDNQANRTLEHATIDLLYPAPKWLQEKLRKKGTPVIQANCLVTTDGLFITANGKCISITQPAITCLETSEGILLVNGKCLEINQPEAAAANCLQVDGKLLDINGKCLALNEFVCLETTEGTLVMDNGKCLSMNKPPCLETSEGLLVMDNGKCLGLLN